MPKKKFLKYSIVSGVLVGFLLLQGCGVGGKGIASTSAMEKSVSKDILANAHSGGFIAQDNLFNEGLLPVGIRNKMGDMRYGYINKKGDMVIEAKFELASKFHNGYGYINTQNPDGYWDIHYIDKQGNRCEGIAERADFLGKDLAPPKRVYHDFNGRPYFAEDGNKSEKNKNYTVKRALGDDLIQVRYDPENRYAILNSRGKWNSGFDFQDIQPFHIKSRRTLASRDGEHYGLIDEYGRPVGEQNFYSPYNFIFDQCGTFFTDSFLRYDLFPVAKEKGGLLGYIDEKGKFEIPPTYDYAEPFCKEGLALVRQGQEYFFINTKGKKAFDRTFKKTIKRIF